MRQTGRLTGPTVAKKPGRNSDSVAIARLGSLPDGRRPRRGPRNTRPGLPSPHLHVFRADSAFTLEDFGFSQAQRKSLRDARTMGKPLHPKTYPPLDQKDKRRIVTLYTQHHLNITQLTERYRGVTSADAIAKTLKEAGVEIERSRQ